MEKLIEVIVSEILLSQKQLGVDIEFINGEKSNSGFIINKEINTSNCKTSELSEKYLLSIKSEENNLMAL